MLLFTPYFERGLYCNPEAWPDFWHRRGTINDRRRPTHEPLGECRGMSSAPSRKILKFRRSHETLFSTFFIRVQKVFLQKSESRSIVRRSKFFALTHPSCALVTIWYKTSSFISLVNSLMKSVRSEKKNARIMNKAGLPFPDILVKRNNNKSFSSIYRKKKFTDLYTKWDS